MMEKGVFCLTLDTELLWGRLEKELSSYIIPAQKTRSVIKRLLNLFKKYDVAVTWAVVGHLFLENCSPKRGVKHPEIIRPNFPDYQKDWFDHDPCTSLEKDPLWYGKDIVKQIKKTPQQEIACHTFSHIPIGHPGCNQKSADSEIGEWVKLAKKENIKYKTFVFPKSLIGHLDVLKKHGLVCYRSSGQYWFSGLGLYKKIGQIIDYLFCLTPLVSKPRKNKYGLIVIKESMIYLSMKGLRRFIPMSCRIIKAKKGIDKAIEKKAVFNLLFHPVDLADGSDKLISGLEQIIKYALLQNKAGKLEIKSMGQIAEDHLTTR